MILIVYFHLSVKMIKDGLAFFVPLIVFFFLVYLSLVILSLSLIMVSSNCKIVGLFKVYSTLETTIH